MTSTITTIKNKVIEQLETFDAIKSVKLQRFGTFPWDIDAPGYPVAIVTSPSMVSEVLDNASNLRTYDMTVYIVFDADKVKSDGQEVDELFEDLMDHFDVRTTMEGIFNGYVSPSTVGPMPIEGNQNRAMGSLRLKISVATDVMNCS
jgi:hypothetical protein